jgi:ribonuclease HI
VGSGTRTNNFSKLMALTWILILALEKGVQRIQIFGDSQLVFQWMRKVMCLEELLVITFVE